MECENNVLIFGKDHVVVFIVQAMGMLAARLQGH